MYLVQKGNKNKGYESLSRLLKEEGIDRGVKKQLAEMLEGHPVMIGDLLIEKLIVDTRI